MQNQSSNPAHTPRTQGNGNRWQRWLRGMRANGQAWAMLDAIHIELAPAFAKLRN